MSPMYLLAKRGWPSGGWPNGGWPSGGWPNGGWPSGGWPNGGWPSVRIPLNIAVQVEQDQAFCSMLYREQSVR